MSRVLSKNVVVGGRVYPAGSTVDDEVAAKITADVWVEPVEAPENDVEETSESETESEAEGDKTADAEPVDAPTVEAAPRTRRGRKSED